MVLATTLQDQTAHEIEPAAANDGNAPEIAAPAYDLASDEIALVLGDFIPKIPVRFLRHAEQNEKREVRFKVAEISSMIAAGETKIPLTRIAEARPDIFREDVEDFQTTEVYFPWKKLAGIITRIKRAATEMKSGEIETLAEKTPTAGRDARPVASPASSKIAAKNGLRSQTAARLPTTQTEILTRQRDLAIQQRDQALARLKDAEERVQKQIDALTMERNLAINEKADALAFVALHSRVNAAACAN